MSLGTAYWALLPVLISLGQGMVRQNQFTKPLVQDVSVDLRRCQIRMSQHDLNRAQVGAAGQEVGRKGMAESVRGHAVGWDPSLRGKILEQSKEPLPSQVARCTS